MSAAIRLGAAAAVLLFACTRDISGKTACNVATDCVAGHTCVAFQCMPIDGGGVGGGGGSGGGNGGSTTGGTSGNTGGLDGGRDGLPPSICPMSPVNVCPADPGSNCAEIFCGGRLWRNGLMKSILVPYRINDPGGLFSASYRNAIRASAAAWARASAGFVRFQECTVCSGRFITVVPGDGDGITDPDEMEQHLPMPVVGSGGRVSPHRIAHQWGHALGLSHTYERADRDRYVGFDPDRWCPPAGSGLPPHCAAGPAGITGLPDVTTGTFGVFDEKSKMNGLRSEGICGVEEPDEDSGEPTIGDISALAELFFGATGTWSPFRPIGRSVSPTQPLDYQLAPGVDPTGSPQIAEIKYASPEIFVRGTDQRVYTTALNASTAEWLDWTPVAEDVDADPAVVFAWLATNPETLFLAVRSQLDGQIHLRARRDGYWYGWTALGAPPAGAASAPALASESPSSLAVFVRGGDGLIYHLACTDALSDCAASAAAPGAWTALPAPSASGIFVGKPSAIWPIDSVTGLTVAAIRDDRVAMYITSLQSGGSGWLPADNITADLDPDDPDPGVAIATTPNPGDLAFFARNQQGLLAGDTLSMKFFSIGGVLASPPGVVGFYHNAIRTEVAAIILDHGHPGVWWRYDDLDYTAPCYYNSPAACLQCGLDPP